MTHPFKRLLNDSQIGLIRLLRYTNTMFSLFNRSKPSLKGESSGLPLAFIQALNKALPPDCLLDETSERLTYEADACVLFKEVPSLVVVPDTPEHVEAIIKLCHEHQVPFVPRGGGTGTSGGSLPVTGGILLALNKLNQIESIDVDRRCAWVQVGVVNARINEALAPHGLYYAPDPSSQGACTIGGNVAENAGGMHCFKHGVTVDHIQGLEMVLPNGQLIRVGGPTYGCQGPDVLRLLIGSEGTLGVVTRVCIRLSPKPETMRLFQATYATTEQACNVVSQLVQHPVQPAAIEFLDTLTVKAVNSAFKLGFNEESAALLLVEVSGPEAHIAYETEVVDTILRSQEPLDCHMADTPEEAKRLWKARKGTAGAYGRIAPAFFVHDCVIPRSKTAEILAEIEAIAKRFDLPVANVFHAGDGNLHPNVLFDPNNPDERHRSHEAGNAILKACLDAGGTLSGEHGIGVEKREAMAWQFTEADLHWMHQVRHTFDPHSLSNPGKVFPLKRTCGEAGLQHACDHSLSQDGETGHWI